MVIDNLIKIGPGTFKGLPSGAKGELRWGSQGDRVSFEYHWFMLVLEWRQNGHHGEVIEITRTDGHINGSSRPWFTCPVCGRRSNYLYLERTWKCQKCTGMKYRSTKLPKELHRAMKVYDPPPPMLILDNPVSVSQKLAGY